MKTYPIAMISGASQGIGKACASGLAKKGYRTVLVSRNEKKLQQTADEIRKDAGENQGLHPVVYPFDITRFNEIKTLIDDIFSRFGRIDLLVNNAGIFQRGTLETSASEFEQMFHTNLFGPFYILQQVIPIMKKQGRGHIFNIASRAGKTGLKGEGVYSATKHGLVGLNESLFRELAQDGISVTAICPGWVNTDMANQGDAPLSDAEMIQPEDIIKTILWILDLAPNTCVKEVSLDCYKSII